MSSERSTGAHQTRDAISLRVMRELIREENGIRFLELSRGMNVRMSVSTKTKGPRIDLDSLRLPDPVRVTLEAWQGGEYVRFRVSSAAEAAKRNELAEYSLRGRLRIRELETELSREFTKRLSGKLSTEQWEFSRELSQQLSNELSSESEAFSSGKKELSGQRKELSAQAAQELLGSSPILKERVDRAGVAVGDVASVHFEADLAMKDEEKDKELELLREPGL